MTVSHPDSWVHRNQERRCRSGRRWNQVYRRRSEFVDPACRSYPPSRLRCTHSLQTENINIFCPRCFLTIQVIHLPFAADNRRSERQKTGSKLLSKIVRIVSITNRTPLSEQNTNRRLTLFSVCHIPLRFCSHNTGFPKTPSNIWRTAETSAAEQMRGERGSTQRQSEDYRTNLHASATKCLLESLI